MQWDLAIKTFTFLIRGQRQQMRLACVTYQDEHPLRMRSCEVLLTKHA